MNVALLLRKRRITPIVVAVVVAAAAASATVLLFLPLSVVVGWAGMKCSFSSRPQQQQQPDLKRREGEREREMKREESYTTLCVRNNNSPLVTAALTIHQLQFAFDEVNFIVGGVHFERD